MLIPCPWCGQREEVEFTYGGPVPVSYPQDPEAVDDSTWARYVYFRPNPKGRLIERWVHGAGCRRWFTLERDTVSHAIAPPGEPTP